MRLGTYFGHRPKIAGQTGNCQSQESCVIVNKLFMLSSSGAKAEIETMVSIRPEGKDVREFSTHTQNSPSPPIQQYI